MYKCFCNNVLRTFKTLNERFINVTEIMFAHNFESTLPESSENIGC